jgi:hypothetical protein
VTLNTLANALLLLGIELLWFDGRLKETRSWFAYLDFPWQVAVRAYLGKTEIFGSPLFLEHLLPWFSWVLFWFDFVQAIAIG